MMKILRRAVALVIALLIVLPLAACGYKPVKSTEEESKTVVTLDGGAISVPYEVYRFAFLSEKALLGDAVKENMSDAEKAALFATLDRSALEEICGFYAIFSLCAKYGIDPYSKEINKSVDEGIIAAIEGDGEYVGYGDYDTYLAKIKEAYLNDSTFRFLLRYRDAEATLGGHLRDTGVISSAKETVLAYMNSEDCVRASWIYIPFTMLENYTDARLAEMQAQAKAASDSEFLRLTHTVVPDAYTDAELDIGFYIGEYQLDAYYERLTQTVFSLQVGETSDWIKAADGVYLVRRLPKDAAYLADEKNLSDFTEYYLLNSFYRMVKEEQERLLETVTPSEAHNALRYDDIHMGT